MQLDFDILWAMLSGSSSSPSIAQSGGSARSSATGASLSVSAARGNQPAVSGKQVAASRSSASAQQHVCPDAAPILFAMLRVLLNQQQPASHLHAQRLSSEGGVAMVTRLYKPEPIAANASGVRSRNYPLTIMQFFMMLYQTEANIQTTCLTADFLAALISVLFPINGSADSPPGIPAPELFPVIRSPLVISKVYL